MTDSRAKLTDGPTSIEQESIRSELKEKIKSLLETPEHDPLTVVELANKLADLDESFLRFSVDASHVERLGYELVGKQSTALGELIKNSYDADATTVVVEISNESEAEPGYIRIEDDGTGMSFEDIRKAWMRISTDNKVAQPLSKRFGRRRAGKKGIGRFAVQRLGRRLTLITGEEGKSQGWRATFHWDEKYIRGQDITLIRNNIEAYTKSVSVHGTTLKIEGLRDAWDVESVQAAWKSILLLQMPVRDKPAIVPTEKDVVDPGFQSLIELRGNGDDRLAYLDIESEIAKSALATISAVVDESGSARCEVHSAKLNLHDSSPISGDFSRLGPCTVEIDYFIYSSELFTGIKMNAAQRITREIGGIRLYRNGFRVAPYGDNDDDWLGLGVESARRVILVPTNNSNFLGRVYIDSKNNPTLEETASREGLIHNFAYDLLIQFVREAIYWAVKRVGWARQKKLTTNEPTKRVSSDLGHRVSSLLQALRSSRSDDAADAIQEQITEAVSSYERSVQRAQEESIRYEAMLRVLASLGLSISVFAHEVRAASSFADDSTHNFVRRAGELNLLDEGSKLIPQIEAIEHGVSRITVLGDYLGGLTAYSGTRRLMTIALPTVVEEFSNRIGSYLAGQGVELIIRKPLAPPRTCPIHRSEVDSVLFNLVSNSLKAIKRSKVDKGIIDVESGVDGKYVTLIVSDNGDGIDEAIRDKVFDAFFTTTGDDDDEELVTGAGLGLKIVADIASNYGGSVRVITPPSGLSTSIEFRVLAFDKSIHAL